MMMEFLSSKRIAQRAVTIAAFLLLIGLGLQYYNINREAITNFKLYYMKSYAYAASRRIVLGVDNDFNKPNNAKAKSIPVLVYHGVLNENDNVSVSLEQFKTQMFALKDAGYQTVHIGDFNEYLKGERELPDKSFLLTFDDGRKDSYYPVDPILKELDYSAVMFVITGTLGPKTNKYHLTTDELREMQKSGRWDLEAHTYEGHGLIDIDSAGTKGHFYSNKIWLPNDQRLETDQEFTDRVIHDLAKAKQDMKDFFGIDSFALAFPFNDAAKDSKNFPNAQVIFNVAAKSQYDRLFYQAEPPKGFTTNLYGSNASLIRRINIETDWKVEDLLTLLEKGREKPLPLEFSSFNSDQGWKNPRGVLFFDKGELNLNSDELHNSGLAILDGTASLTDYDLTVDANWKETSNFMFRFNHRTSSDFQKVSITSNELKVSRVSDTGEQIILQKVINKLDTKIDHKLHFRKSGQYLSIVLDGQEIATNISTIDDDQSGGIGFEVWDPLSANAVATIKHLSIVNNQ